MHLSPLWMRLVTLLIPSVLVVACRSPAANTKPVEPGHGAVASAMTAPVPATQAIATRAASGATSAAPSQHKLRGRIAYSTRSGDIWVMQADGSGRKQVTRSGSGLDFDPSLSPDGSQIVFRTSRGSHAPDPRRTGAEGIFVVNTDGTDERQLWPADGRSAGGLFPDWSPDGSRIALTGYRADGTETIYTLKPDGSGLTDLGAPNSSGQCIEWSPDSKRLMFCHIEPDTGFDVWVMNADGSAKQQLTNAPGNDYPGIWSPDSRQIAFSSERDGNVEVYIMNDDGSDQRRLTNNPAAEGPEAWLPDGRLVVSSFADDAPLPEWYLLRPGGTGKEVLPQLRGAGSPLDWLP